jgi:hypothetical protein
MQTILVKSGGLGSGVSGPTPKTFEWLLRNQTWSHELSEKSKLNTLQLTNVTSMTPLPISDGSRAATIEHCYAIRDYRQ